MLFIIKTLLFLCKLLQTKLHLPVNENQGSGQEIPESYKNNPKI
mgnify:CR=1 FL=1